MSGPQECELCPVTGSFAAAERAVMNTSQLPSGSAVIRTAPPPPPGHQELGVRPVGGRGCIRARVCVNARTGPREIASSVSPLIKRCRAACRSVDVPEVC